MTLRHPLDVYLKPNSNYENHRKETNDMDPEIEVAVKICSVRNNSLASISYDYLKNSDCNRSYSASNYNYSLQIL